MRNINVTGDGALLMLSTVVPIAMENAATGVVVSHHLLWSWIALQHFDKVRDTSSCFITRSSVLSIQGLLVRESLQEHGFAVVRFFVLLLQVHSVAYTLRKPII